MDESNKPELIMGTVLIAFIAVAAFVTYHNITYTPRFKVGNCIVYVKSGNEFEPPVKFGPPLRILEIGKKYYKTTVPYKRLNPHAEFETIYIRTADDTHELTECTGAE